jgi:RNA polymerase sigma factor (sigma-70 family)
MGTVLLVPTNAELLAGCARGDRVAWNRLVDRYTPMMWSVARSYRLGSADCEDVIQATWIRVFNSLRTIHSPERLGGWIATATGREALKHLQAQRKHIPVGDGRALDRPDDAAALPEDVVVGRDRDARLLEAFRDLSPQCRELLGLLTQDPPPSYDELSAALNIPRGSIGPTRSRCLTRLAKVLAAREAGTPPPAPCRRRPQTA